MKMLPHILTCATVVVLAPLAPQQAEAQSASLTATAIVAGALNLSSSRDLNFGTVIPGINRVIQETDPTSGAFLVVGGVNAEVDLSYSSLPANLTDGVNNLPVSYTGTWNTSDAGGTGTSFTPTLGLTTRLDAATGELYVYMGGTVTPGAGQPAGTYNATITLDAAYTGN